jgi:hypothetical protein
MPDRKHQIRPDHPIQIPRATQSRDSRVIDACILFVFGGPDGDRVTKNKELARITGASEKNIQEAKRDDKWEDHRLDLIAKQMEQREGGDLAFFQRQRTPEQQKMIADERERQRLEIPKLEEQAAAVLEGMKENPPGSKLYPGLVTALDRLTKMIEDRTGKATEDMEVADMQKALIKIAARGQTFSDKKIEQGQKPGLVVDVLPE